MYGNPYYANTYNIQPRLETINNQIAELEKMKTQLTATPMQANQPAINQTFQLAPTGQTIMKYVNTIDDVNKEIVYGDTPFFSKDMTVLWIKNNKGEVKAYELNEIIQKDEKDLKIDYLIAQIAELKKGMKNNESDANVNESTAESVEK